VFLLAFASPLPSARQHHPTTRGNFHDLPNKFLWSFHAMPILFTGNGKVWKDQELAGSCPSPLLDLTPLPSTPHSLAPPTCFRVLHHLPLPLPNKNPQGEAARTARLRRACGLICCYNSLSSISAWFQFEVLALDSLTPPGD
jgi:hypothetical protein